MKIITKGLTSIILLISSCLALAKPTTVAVMLALSGSQASLGAEAMKGFVLATTRLNPADSQRLTFSLNNSQSQEKIAQQIAQGILSNVSLAAGFTDNNAVIAVGPALEKFKVPLLSIGATDPRLPTQFGNQVFLVPFGDNTQAAAAAEFSANKFGKNVAILWDKSSDYTTELPLYFAARFKQLNGNIILNESFSGCSINTKPLANQLKQVDFIYLAGLPNCIGQTILSLRQQGIETPIIGGDGLDTPNLLKKNLSKVWFTTHAWLSPQNKDKKVQQFIQDYKKLYGQMPEGAFAALGYDAAMLINTANKRAKNQTPRAIKAALENIQNYDGISGKISYSHQHHVPKKTVWIIQVTDGEKQLASQFVPTKIPNAKEISS